MLKAMNTLSPSSRPDAEDRPLATAKLAAISFFSSIVNAGALWASQVLGVSRPQLRVLGLGSDDGVLQDSVAEAIHHRRVLPKKMAACCASMGQIRSHKSVTISEAAARYGILF